MNTEKEIWINRILSSGSALKDLEFPHRLDSKVLAGVKDLQTDQLISTPRLRLAIAASLALVLLNVFALGLWKPAEVQRTESELGAYNLNIYQSE